MNQNLQYWYGNFGSSNLISDLPVQAIPKSKKNEKWKKACMNALERIGIQQFNDNLRFVDYYRMTEGKVSYTEISALMPQLSQVEDILDDLEIPNTIRHYDLLGIIVKYLQTVMMENRDKFHPMTVDEISSNEKQRALGDALKMYIKNKWGEELNRKLIEAGLDPTKDDFEDEEEQEQYLQQLQAKEDELTPESIKKFFDKEYKPIIVEWAEHTLEADSINFGENGYGQDEIDRDLIDHYLKSGRCFQHFYASYDNYTSNVWHPVQTFFSQTLDSKYPQYGEYIGRIHFYTPSDFINLYGSKFNKKVTEKIINLNKSYEAAEEGAPDFNTALQSNFYNTHLVPHANFHDYNFLVDLQDHIGIPLAHTTITKKDGTTETVEDYLPRRLTSMTNNVSRYARFLNEDLNLRTDMIMVTEAYWRSFKKVGLLTYLSPEGAIVKEIVTEDILDEMIKVYGIKEITNLSIEEWDEHNDINTIVWQYVPEIYQGKKALTSGTMLKEDLFFDIKPMEYQLKSKSNLYDVMLPVAGIVDENPSDKVINWQNLYNIVMNQMYNLLEKEIGVFFLFDINFLPSDIKSYGDTETALWRAQSIAKQIGFLATDGSAKNIAGGAPTGQGFQIQDMSLSAMISAKSEQAEYFKNKAFEQFGISPQILGEPVKYQTAEGVQQMAESTRTQTDYLYEAFRNFKQRALEMHLSIAQFAQGDGTDIRVEYTKSDQSQVFLKFSDPNFPLRRFGVVAASNAKKRKELEMIKNYMLSQNTMGSDEYSLTQIIQSDSIIQLMEISRLERQRRELLDEQAHLRKMNEIEKEGELEENKKFTEWLLSEKSKEADRANRIEVARITATGRASDNNATKFALDYIQKTADRSQRQQQHEDNLDLKVRELEEKIANKRNEILNGDRKMDLEERKLDVKEKEMDNDRYIAQINKN